MERETYRSYHHNNVWKVSLEFQSILFSHQHRYIKEQGGLCGCFVYRIFHQICYPTKMCWLRRQGKIGTQLRCNQLAYRFYCATRPYQVNFFKLINANPSIITWSIVERIESYHGACVGEIDAADNVQISAKDPLEIIWIDWQRNCSNNKKWCAARDGIIAAIVVVDLLTKTRLQF